MAKWLGVQGASWHSINIFLHGARLNQTRLLLSFIALTRLVLNPMNCDVKSFGHAIVFAPHPTDWNSDGSQPANNNRFIQHGLDSVKYLCFSNEISELK